MDWRAERKIGRVRNQGSCAACWAFVVCGMLERAYSIILNRDLIPNLSEQYWINCDSRNGGCRGGNTKLALEFVKEIRGLYYEGEIPYVYR